MQQGVVEGREILRVQAELGHLELEQLEQFLNARMQRDRNHVELVAGQHAGEGAVLSAKVLDQSGVGGQGGADLLERSRRSDQAGLVGFRGGGVLHSPHQVGLAQSRLLFELFDALLRTLFGTQLLALDQVVVPVKFLAKVADRSHQLALPGIGGAGDVHRLHEQIHQGAGLGLLDVAKSFLEAVGTVEAKVYQVFVDFQLVLEEGDFQFFSAQLAAHVLDGLARAAVGLIRCLRLGNGSRNFSHQKFGLIEQEGRIDLLQDCASCLALTFGQREIVYTQRDSRQKEFGEHRLALHGGGTEEIKRSDAQALRFEKASFIEQNERLVEIDERRPDLVLIAHEHLFRLREQLDGFKRLAGATGCDGGERESFGSLVTEAQVLEGLVGGASQFTGFGAQVQF